MGGTGSGHIGFFPLGAPSLGNPSTLRTQQKLESDGIKRVRGRKHALILYPNLGMPDLVNVGAGIKEKIHLVVFTSPKSLDGKSEFNPFDVNWNLKLFTYDELLRYKKGESPLAKEFDSLMESGPVSQGAIEVRELGKPSELVEIPHKFFRGKLCETTIGYYEEFWKKKKLGDGKLFLVTVSTDGFTEAWARKVRENRKLFLCWCTTKQLLPGQGSSDEDKPMAREAEDEALQDILFNTKPDGKEPLFIGEFLQGREKVWQKDPGNAMGNLYNFDPIQFKMDPSTLLASYHPVYFSKAPDKHLNIAFMSDLHLVTKFKAMRESPIRAMPGVTDLNKDHIGPSDAPHIGSELLLDTIDVLAGLFKDAAADPDVDVLIIGGDLIDFSQDLLPKSWDKLGKAVAEAQKATHGKNKAARYASEKKVWETVWEFCALGKEATDNDDNWQLGTAMLSFFHLSLKFALTCDKPLIFLTGNHDAYHRPFGISPRVANVGSDSGTERGPGYAEAAKGNMGIPADCNLTIFEACLTFGKSFGKAYIDPAIIADPSAVLGSTGFNAAIMDLMYLLFNPFRTFTTKLEKFQLIGMDWGKHERMFFGNKDKPFGDLPVANDSLSDEDVEIVRYAVKLAREQRSAKVVLASHYTWACYGPALPIMDDKNLKDGNEHPRNGTFPLKPAVFDDWPTAWATQRNVGTARLNRHKIFSLFNMKAKGKDQRESGIHYCISGHAHRPAVYRMVGNLVKEGEWKRTKGLLEFLSSPVKEYVDLAAKMEFTESHSVNVRGYHFDELNRYHSELDPEEPATNRYPYLVVSASAGPIPRENRGKFDGWASVTPSYTSMVFDDHGALKRLASKGSKLAKAKPRLGVTFDYMEIAKIEDAAFDRTISFLWALAATYIKSEAAAYAEKAGKLLNRAEDLYLQACDKVDKLIDGIKHEAKELGKKAAELAGKTKDQLELAKSEVKKSAQKLENQLEKFKGKVGGALDETRQSVEKALSKLADEVGEQAKQLENQPEAKEIIEKAKRLKTELDPYLDKVSGELEKKIEAIRKASRENLPSARDLERLAAEAEKLVEEASAKLKKDCDQIARQAKDLRSRLQKEGSKGLKFVVTFGEDLKEFGVDLAYFFHSRVQAMLNNAYYRAQGLGESGKELSDRLLKAFQSAIGPIHRPSDGGAHVESLTKQVPNVFSVTDGPDNTKVIKIAGKQPPLPQPALARTLEEKMEVMKRANIFSFFCSEESDKKKLNADRETKAYYLHSGMPLEQFKDWFPFLQVDLLLLDRANGLIWRVKMDRSPLDPNRWEISESRNGSVTFGVFRNFLSARSSGNQAVYIQYRFRDLPKGWGDYNTTHPWSVRGLFLPSSKNNPSFAIFRDYWYTDFETCIGVYAKEYNEFNDKAVGGAVGAGSGH